MFMDESEYVEHNIDEYKSQLSQYQCIIIYLDIIVRLDA